jgi:uncharacterized protein YecE (DUF72 family)
MTERVGRIRVGTSGFSYKEWRPSFYPEGTSDKKFLSYYAGVFSCVEIDGTFYRMPNAKTIERWIGETPDTFRFAVKASQKITHFERMRLPSDALAYFTRIVATLGERLGTVLFQLPPNLKRDDDRLAKFLEALPKDLPRAFEFRNASWFDGATYELLRAHDAALCIHDADDGMTPFEVTASPVYVRLRRAAYDEALLGDWSQKLAAIARAGRDVYAFIKHEDNPDCPDIARSLAERVAAEAAA